MGILQQILSELKDSPTPEQVKIICDQIYNQEKDKANQSNIENAPKGPLIYLALEVKGRYRGEVGFLTLERENEEEFSSVYYSAPNGTPLKIRKVWNIKENKPEKILTEYAKKFKMLRGE